MGTENVGICDSVLYHNFHETHKVLALLFRELVQGPFKFKTEHYLKICGIVFCDNSQLDTLLHATCNSHSRGMIYVIMIGLNI